MTNNLFHNLPTGFNPPKEVNCIVEIPKGGINKYEYDKEQGVFVLDRVLHETVFFPTEYGFIPQTWRKEDKDPLDIMVFSTHPTFPGCKISSRPIGVLKMKDSGKMDDKIIAVPKDDPRFSHVKKIEDISPHAKKEIEFFWENYAKLQPKKKIEIIGWGDTKEAYKLIEESRKAYKEKYSKLRG